MQHNVWSAQILFRYNSQISSVRRPVRTDSVLQAAQYTSQNRFKFDFWKPNIIKVVDICDVPKAENHLQGELARHKPKGSNRDRLLMIADTRPIGLAVVLD